MTPQFFADSGEAPPSKNQFKEDCKVITAQKRNLWKDEIVFGSAMVLTSLMYIFKQVDAQNIAPVMTGLIVTIRAAVAKLTSLFEYKRQERIDRYCEIHDGLDTAQILNANAIEHPIVDFWKDRLVRNESGVADESFVS